MRKKHWKKNIEGYKAIHPLSKMAPSLVYYEKNYRENVEIGYLKSRNKIHIK